LVASSAVAQNQTANVGRLVSGLLNVNIQNVQVDVETGDITVVNVQDVLQDFEITILETVIIRNVRVLENAEILTNLLREANILNDSQIVVGILSGPLIVISDVESFPNLAGLFE
jgi:hypothetical protein